MLEPELEYERSERLNQIGTLSAIDRSVPNFQFPRQEPP